MNVLWRIRFRLIFTALLWTVSGQARADAFDQSGPSPVFVKIDFFQNSSRRNPHPDGSLTNAMVKVVVDGSSCSGFFVNNSAHRLLVATARHCADYHFTDACNQGKIKVGTHAGQYWGTCASVVAGDEDHDAVIFEAKFPIGNETVLRRIRFADISAQEPPAGTRLILVGYPADPERNEALTVSENCWANTGIDSGRYLTAQESAGNAGGESNEYSQWTDYVRSRENMIAYNCDVYGGNSGGPVALEDSQVVVGMPATYYEGVYRRLPWQASAWFFSLDGFIQTNAQTLRSLGVYWQ